VNNLGEVVMILELHRLTRSRQRRAASHGTIQLFVCPEQRVVAVRCRRHSYIMPIRPSVETRPDLFSARPTAKVPEPPAVSESKASPGGLDSPRRHLLPKDLAGALKRLDDNEIDALLAAVTTEAERRGRLPPLTSRGQVERHAKQSFVETSPISLCSLLASGQSWPKPRAWSFSRRRFATLPSAL
jgi:hypothetical protein